MHDVDVAGVLNQIHDGLQAIAYGMNVYVELFGFVMQGEILSAQQLHFVALLQKAEHVVIRLALAAPP